MKGARFQAEAIRLWVSGLSSGQIAAAIGKEIGEPVSRNRVVGVIYRAGKRLLAATGVNPYARPDQSFNTRNGLRYPDGYKPRPPKRERTLRVVTVKPPQIKRVIKEKDVTPGERLPPLVKLDDRLWLPLPNTSPKALVDLNVNDCRWPVDSQGTTLFCAVEKAEGSSCCAIHHRWGHSQKALAPLNFNKRVAA